MEQASQTRSAAGVFPYAAPGADARDGWTPGATSTLLLVGSRTCASDPDLIDGVRLAAVVPAIAAAEHIAAMLVLDMVWLAGADAIAPDMLAGIGEAVAERGCPLICETSLDALERVATTIPATVRVEWLVDADATDRRVALAAARREFRQVVHDVTRDPALERIDRLQEEVARISRLLGDLAAQRPGLAGTPTGYPPSGEGYSDYAGPVRAPLRDFATMPRSFVPEERTVERQRAKTVRRMLRQRRLREQYFPADLFADPAWDMLLDLYAARLERQPVSVSSLCIAAAVPATTALRWIKTMTDAGIFLREADPRDGRRIFIALAESACEAMTSYFDALDE